MLQISYICYFHTKRCYNKKCKPFPQNMLLDPTSEILLQQRYIYDTNDNISWEESSNWHLN